MIIIIIIITWTNKIKYLRYHTNSAKKWYMSAYYWRNKLNTTKYYWLECIFSSENKIRVY